MDGAPESVFMAQNKAGAIPKARGEMTSSLLSTFPQTWMYLGQTKMLALITSVPSASSEDQKEAPSSVLSPILKEEVPKWTGLGVSMFFSIECILLGSWHYQESSPHPPTATSLHGGLRNYIFFLLSRINVWTNIYCVENCHAHCSTILPSRQWHSSVGTSYVPRNPC